MKIIKTEDMHKILQETFPKSKIPNAIDNLKMGDAMPKDLITKMDSIYKVINTELKGELSIKVSRIIELIRDYNYTDSEYNEIIVLLQLIEDKYPLFINLLKYL